MNIGLSRFKVAYSINKNCKEEVFNAIALLDIEPEDEHIGFSGIKFISVMVLTDNGTPYIIRDRAFKFRFIPIDVNE